MRPLADITDARTVIRTYLETAASVLPAETFEQFARLADSPAPVDQICRSAELLYARRDELDDAGRVLVAQLSSFAAQFAFHGMATDNRGGRMAMAMLRDVGEAPAPGLPAYPEPEADPKPQIGFVAQTPPPPPPPVEAA